VLHLMLQSLALIVFILISMILCDALVQRLMANPSLDWRRMQTLRTVLELGLQVWLACSFCLLSSDRRAS